MRKEKLPRSDTHERSMMLIPDIMREHALIHARKLVSISEDAEKLAERVHSTVTSDATMRSLISSLEGHLAELAYISAAIRLRRMGLTSNKKSHRRLSSRRVSIPRKRKDP